MKISIRPDGTISIPLDQIKGMSPEEYDRFIEIVAELEIQASAARLKAEKEESTDQ